MKQDVYVASSTPKYPLATRYAKRGDPLCRAWRYTELATTTRTGGLWGTTGYGGISQGLGLFSVSKPSGDLTIVRAVIGEKTVTISNPALTVNAYAGGFLSMYESGQPYCMRGIISNTATVIYLDGRLPGTYAAGVNANSQVIPSPYHEVVMPGLYHSAGAVFDYCPGIFISALDENGNDPEAGDFVWLQTWGVCYMWVSGVYEGGVGGEREVVVCGDGGAQVLRPGIVDPYGTYQHIGCLYPSTGDVAVGDNPDPADGTDPENVNNLIFLKIAP